MLLCLLRKLRPSLSRRAKLESLENLVKEALLALR